MAVGVRVVDGRMLAGTIDERVRVKLNKKKKTLFQTITGFLFFISLHRSMAKLCQRVPHFLHIPYSSRTLSLSLHLSAHFFYFMEQKLLF